MSDNIYNYDQEEGETGYPDNYDEGWYQDEYGNWLNQFDWKQVNTKIYFAFCRSVFFNLQSSIFERFIPFN